MAETGSAAPYIGATLDQLHESIGIPQFGGAAAENWSLVFNGLTIQGGSISVADGPGQEFPFVDKFPLQVLGVFLQIRSGTIEPSVPSTTLNTFTVDYSGSSVDCYWWAIGV